MLSVKISGRGCCTQGCPGGVDLTCRQVGGEVTQVGRRRCYGSVGRIHTDDTWEGNGHESLPAPRDLREGVTHTTRETKRDGKLVSHQLMGSVLLFPEGNWEFQASWSVSPDSVRVNREWCSCHHAATLDANKSRERDTRSHVTGLGRRNQAFY